MATVRYFVEKPGRTGLRHFWQPAAGLRAEGWQPCRLSNDRATALAEAELLNAKLDAARAGSAAAPGAGGATGATLDHVIARYKADAAYRDCAPKTRAGYDYCARILSAWSGDAPVGAITRPLLKAFYRHVRMVHPAKANAVLRFARIVLNFAVSEDLAAVNVARDVRLKGTGQKGRLWSREAVAAFVAAADAAGRHSIGTAVVLNEWLGQREGDVLALKRAAYAGGRIAVTQAKTGARVELPVDLVAPLARRLEDELARQASRKVTALAPDRALLIDERTGRAWNTTTFIHAFAEVRAAAVQACPELEGLFFMHLRHTAITRLAEAGVEIPGIAAITGHSLASAQAIVDRYLVRTASLARGAFQKRLDAEAR